MAEMANAGGANAEGANAGGAGPGASPGPLDTLAFLRGTWALTRSVRDRRWTGRFVGVATCSPLDADALLYRETGVLAFAGRDVPATRAYRYLARGDGSVEVRFEDGRFFHLLDLSRGAWDADHPCGPDRYRGTFRVVGPDLYTTRWLVTGARDGGPGSPGRAGARPSKDQELFTVYRRLPVGRTPAGRARCPHAHL